MTKKVYNVVESLLWDEVQSVLPRYTDLCNCEQCALDVYTYALNKLPAHYVTGKRFINEVKKATLAKYSVSMAAAIREGVDKIKANPRIECQKKTGFWNSPEPAPSNGFDPVPAFVPQTDTPVVMTPRFATYTQIKRR